MNQTKHFTKWTLVTVFDARFYWNFSASTEKSTDVSILSLTAELSASLSVLPLHSRTLTSQPLVCPNLCLCCNPRALSLTLFLFRSLLGCLPIITTSSCTVSSEKSCFKIESCPVSPSLCMSFSLFHSLFSPLSFFHTLSPLISFRELLDNDIAGNRQSLTELVIMN